MIFNSDIFLFVFLPVVFILFWSCQTAGQRYATLVVSSYIFYGYWNWKFCFLLLFSSLWSFLAGILISRSASARARKTVLFCSVFADLALLGVFKYYNFFMTNVERLLPGIHTPAVTLILPIGISFYTFHTMSYVIDVADGRVKATANILKYLTYVSMFSQLVAGPIVRYGEMEADLKALGRKVYGEGFGRGVGMFAMGFLKKTMVADQIARYVDPLFAQYHTLSVTGAWCAALGYTFQIYFDFSGYSDMAVGLGLLFGIHIPRNFNYPYRAVSVRDFWRRWHISLSTWLRDYLYKKLGGNRLGIWRSARNVCITMLLGGLWHGAQWHFVLWGAYYAALLVIERMAAGRAWRLPEALCRAGTFLLVVVGWVFFRAPSVRSGFGMLKRMAGFERGGLGSEGPLIAWIILCLFVVNASPEPADISFSDRWTWAAVSAAALVLGYLFMNGTETPFLYYQF